MNYLVLYILILIIFMLLIFYIILSILHKKYDESIEDIHNYKDLKIRND